MDENADLYRYLDRLEEDARIVEWWDSLMPEWREHTGEEDLLTEWDFSPRALADRDWCEAF